MRKFILLLVLGAAPSLSAQRGAARSETESRGRPVDSSDVARLARELAAGRVVVHGLRFEHGDERIAAASHRALLPLAQALRGASGAYLVEAHTSGRPDADAVSARRAAAVRARLVADGADPSRLYAAGFGASRPEREGSAHPSRSTDRIEITRLR